MSAGSATKSESQQLVVFSLRGEEYALPIEQVQEIIRYSEPRAVASEAAWIRGVISLRGKIIPVCDLSTRLGLATDDKDRANIVIVETDGGTAGVLVDDVEEVLTIARDQIDEIPSAGADFIDAIAKVDDRLVVLLNAVSIFADTDLQAVAA